jgi:hypothetical protein
LTGGKKKEEGEKRKGRKASELTGVVENFVGFVNGCHLGFAPAFVWACCFGGTMAVISMLVKGERRSNERDAQCLLDSMGVGIPSSPRIL